MYRVEAQNDMEENDREWLMWVETQRKLIFLFLNQNIYPAKKETHHYNFPIKISF